jgi:hypothetical protein
MSGGKVANQPIDLFKVFQSVAKEMGKNKASLNEADQYNHDHGTNMVETFKVITQAMEEKKDASPADQLLYASQLLRSNQQSGSAQLYADGLARASDQFQGKVVTADNAALLIQALMGGQAQPAQTETPADPMGGLLGSLLGGLTGMAEPAQQSAGQAARQSEASGLDTADLLNAGLQFFTAKQRGASNMEALTSAIMTGSQMNDGGYRSQSGTLVANTLMQVIGKMTAGK